MIYLESSFFWTPITRMWKPYCSMPSFRGPEYIGYWWWLVSDGSTEIITAIIGAVVTILVVGLSYVSSKKNETNVNIRQKKQERYDELVEALTAVVRTLWTNEKDMNTFILAYNKTSAYASDKVVNACQAFFIHLEELRFYWTWSHSTFYI